MNSSFLTSAAVHTLENKWWKHNASFFRGFMTTNARVVFKSICCTISSWFNDSHFLCVFSLFLRFPIIDTLSKSSPKFYLMLIFGAKIQIKKSILFFLIFLAKKEKKSFIAFFTTTRATCGCHHCFALCVNLWVREKLPHHHWKRSSLHLWLNSVSFEVLRKYLNRTKEAHYQCSSL